MKIKIPFTSRYIEIRSSLANPASWLYELLAGGRSTSGVSVNETTAMQCSAVFSCVRVLAETIASLPLPVYRRLSGGGKERATDHYLYSILHDQPNPEMTSFELRETLMGHLCLWGNAYCEIVRDKNGQVMELWPLRPDRMAIKRNQDGRLLYIYTLLTGGQAVLTQSQILHLRGLGGNGIIGYSPIRMAREAIGLALATEEFGARFFGEGTHPGGIMEHPGKLSEQAHQNLKKSLTEAYSGLGKSHRLMILEEGMKYTQIGIPPEDSQYLEVRKFQIAEIARIFRVPLHLVNETDKAATYASVEQYALQFVVHTIRPWLVRWEQAIKRDIFLPNERDIYFAEFLVDGLLRGDIESRYRAYATGRQWGWMSADDIREKENMNPLPDGQGKVYLVPLNMVPASMVGAQEQARMLISHEQRIRRNMTPDDWEEQYKKGTPHWAIDMTPSLFAQQYIEKLKEENITGKLLEIGCGNGRDSIFFARAGFEVTAIDVAPGAISLAQNNAKEAEVSIDFQVANAENLPFEDGAFNALFSLSVLHASDLRKSIPETLRVLVPGGLMLVYIYGNTESINGETEIYTTIDDFIELLKTSGYGILDFYSEQEEEYDEAGERHQILVALVRKVEV